MSYYLMTGAAIGLAAGVSPGPMMAMIIAETLRSGLAAGLRLCLVPLLSDTALVLVALLLTGPLPPWAMAAIGIVGGLVLVWMGWGTVRSGTPAVQEAAAAGSGGSVFWKATLMNLLNPHAILFWLTIGAPTLTTAHAMGPWVAPVSFMVAFFVVMIGAKLVIALGVGKGRRFLQGAGYRWTLGIAGAMLALLGLWRIWEGMAFFWV